MENATPEPHPSAVGTLLLQCLATADENRAVALEQVCRNHPESASALRELYGLLDEFGLVDEPVPAPATPQHLGPYRILEPLGRGGMGEVYLAEHEALGRRVALKVIHEALTATPKARERFRREALAAARLDHPGICPIYEVGDAGGTPFLAMRYVPGTTLQRAIQESRSAGHEMVRLPRRHGDGELAAVLRLCEAAALALHAAHEHGLVHRDIKPGNLMVTPDGDPVLLDFGLARVEDGDGALTLTGDQLGTPCYMAPEQVAGGQVDRRTDVHALGVVLYECLTLRLPFDAVNRHDLQSQILHDEPPDPRRTRRGIGRELSTVLQTALAKEPARRYDTAAAFAEDLRRLRCHEPIRARRAGVLLRLRRFAWRNPVATGFVAFLLVALVVFVVLLRHRDEALRDARVLALVMQARQTLATDPALALRVGLEAHRLEESARTRSLLHDALAVAHERARLRGHGEGRLGGVRATRDGRTILTWSTDGTARLWTDTGVQVAELPHPDKVFDAAFTNDERMVATACDDGKVRLFPRDGGHPREWQAHTGQARSLAVAPVGRVLLTSGRDGIAKLWNDDGTLRQELAEGGGNALDHARFSSAGRWLVTGSTDGKARVYRRDDEDRYRLWREIGHDGVVTMTEITNDETLLLTATGEMTAHGRFWGKRSGDREARLSPLTTPDATATVLAGHGESLSRAAISPDGQLIATATNGGDLHLWTRSGKRLRDVDLGRGDLVSCVTFSPRGDRVIATTIAGNAVLLDRGGHHVATLGNRTESIVAASFTEAGRILIAGATQARICEERIAELQVFRGHTSALFAARFAKDGRQVLTASRDASAILFDRMTGEELARLAGADGHRGYVVDARMTRDGTRILTSSFDPAVKVWDLSGACVQTVPLPAEGSRLCITPDGSRCYVAMDGKGGLLGFPVQDGRLGDPVRVADVDEPCWALAVGAKGTRIVTGTLTSVVRIFDATTWPPVKLHEFSAQRCGHLWSVALSPDGARVLVTGTQPAPIVYGLTGRQLLELPAHEGQVCSGAFSPDGKLIATGGDGVVLSTAKGELVARFGNRTAAPWTVEFSEDSRWLLTGCMDGVARIWCVDSAQLVELAERYSRHRQLSLEECQRFGLPVSLSRE